MTKFFVSESELIEKLLEHFTVCDTDEFARVCGEVFGGECFLYAEENPEGISGEVYEFEPNENYYNAFGKKESFQGVK